MEKTLDQLNAAIAQFASESGPVTFTAQEYDDTLMLSATYSASTTNAEGAALDDEPWTQFGGHKIIDALGWRDQNAGMDRYTDKHGDEMIAQWVCFAKSSEL